MISVVLPVYNAAKFIAASIDSILKQEYSEFELLVIDDGSTDNSLEILNSYSQDSRLRIISSSHVGLSQALNLGIQQAQYPWIARMDADDIASPSRFQRQVAAIHAQPEVVAWGTYAYHINARGKTLGLSRSGPTTVEEFYERRNQGHLVQLIHPTVLLKKEVVLAAGGYLTEFEPVEELELFDRMAAYGPTLALPEPLLFYRIHSQSVSMQRFFFQRQLMRYVAARYRARLEGAPALTLAEFTQAVEQLPWWQKLKNRCKTGGMYSYRRAGLCLGEELYLQSAYYLGLATLLNPTYAFPRIWQQALSPQTRRLLKQQTQDLEI
jgi:glycosyltransferase involved in cell wall biosynthesis